MIVTHGTDTMEDAAFFVAETLGNPDVLFTGSMLPADHPEYDGIRNLTASFIFAKQRRVDGHGDLHEPLLPAGLVGLEARLAAMDAFNIREGKASPGSIEDEVERITDAPDRQLDQRTTRCSTTATRSCRS